MGAVELTVTCVLGRFGMHMVRRCDLTVARTDATGPGGSAHTRWWHYVAWAGDDHLFTQQYSMLVAGATAYEDRAGMHVGVVKKYQQPVHAWCLPPPALLHTCIELFALYGRQYTSDCIHCSRKLLLAVVIS